jgi:Xaa-Pro aminopeptidase
MSEDKSRAVADDAPTPEALPVRASHDPATPPALIDFMLRDWAPEWPTPPAPIDHAGAFAARRRAIAALYPEDVLIIPTGHEKVRANDTYYRFRPSSDFYYLTGCTEADCVLVLAPGGRETLFVEPAGRDDASFFTDRNKGELWTGPRYGVVQSRVRYAIDDCRSLRELPALVAALRAPGQPPVRVVRGFSDLVDDELDEHPRDRELATALAELRLIKDDLEIAELEAAIASTRRGFEDVLRRLPHAHSEREVEGVFNLRARVEGNDVGYGTIAASGAHACILHWTRNDGPLRAGELLLLDAGVEGNSLYTADITRTIPISGHFSVEQRQIYELVLQAQRAAMAVVRPGVDFMEPNRVAMQLLAEGLVALGILRVPAAEALRDDRQLHRRYTLHNVSHMLGLDVHDCAQARQEAYKFGKLRAGMVLTVEPGLYFQRDDLTVPERYRGIGVRIEDDVLVTRDGFRNLSAAIPTGADEVEDWIADSLRLSKNL